MTARQDLAALLECANDLNVVCDAALVQGHGLTLREGLEALGDACTAWRDRWPDAPLPDDLARTIRAAIRAVAGERAAEMADLYALTDDTRNETDERREQRRCIARQVPAPRPSPLLRSRTAPHAPPARLHRGVLSRPFARRDSTAVVT